MEFCPKCGGIVTPSNGELKCSTCGEVIEAQNNDSYKISREIKSKETVKMLGEDVDVLPTTTETCPECGHDKAVYKLLQTRSADEAPTRIFTCTKCKHTWRAYD